MLQKSDGSLAESQTDPLWLRIRTGKLLRLDRISRTIPRSRCRSMTTETPFLKLRRSDFEREHRLRTRNNVLPHSYEVPPRVTRLRP